MELHLHLLILSLLQQLLISTQIVGRLCQLTETTASQNTRDNCSDLQTYIDTLETPASCNSGEPGKLVWTPDENTPDLVYYQVYIT